MPTVFGDFDISDFWEASDYALEEYIGGPVDRDLITAVEKHLGYKLPASYVEFMSIQNGGVPRPKFHRTKQKNSWAGYHIEINGFYSIGFEKPNSLCGEFETKFWQDEWGYPPIGVYFADCPSAGHDMICLDYRKCGPTGEPRVAHVDQESGYKVIVLADNFELFVRGLLVEEPES